MATDIVRSDTAAEPLAAPPPSSPPARMYPIRFKVVYGMLGLAILGSIAGLVVAITNSGVVGGAPAWSSWRPHGGGLGAMKEIANRVGETYRLPNGDQLVDVIATAPSLSPNSGQTIPLHYLAVKGVKGAGIRDYVISPSNSVTYELCGLGTACSIATGKPSAARGTLVRREILELALYTFKYVGGIDHVIAFMPPVSPASQYVVYLQKDDLAAELKQPIEKTLGSKVPLPATIPAREVHVVDSATEPRVYKFGVAQVPTGDFVLVLTPLPA
ncbi:MAG: hypothetical protein E6G62_05925 [Actinobacteria bacterium]|nr:MAG: hypothetical protein E6G62_05925 [Actinomycetota bacterium]